MMQDPQGKLSLSEYTWCIIMCQICSGKERSAKIGLQTIFLHRVMIGGTDVFLEFVVAVCASYWVVRKARLPFEVKRKVFFLAKLLCIVAYFGEYHCTCTGSSDAWSTAGSDGGCTENMRDTARGWWAGRPTAADWKGADKVCWWRVWVAGAWAAWASTTRHHQAQTVLQ